MRWELTQEQDMFREALGDWLNDLAPAENIGTLLDDNPVGVAEFEDRFVADGWFGVGSSEKVGGQGGGLLELALTAEQLGRTAVPSGAWLASVLAVPAIAALPEVSAAVLGAAQFAALVVTAGRPIDRPGTVRCTGDRLSGEVTAVLGAGRAHWLLVPVGTEDDRSLYLVEAQGDGVRTRDRRLLDRSRAAADVVLDAAPGRLLDVDAKRVLADAALRAAVLVAADSLGAAERMLELAVEYSKQRKQFGVPIGTFQAMKHAAATMLVGVEAARSISYFAAASVDERADGSVLAAATAKAQATAHAAQAADSALTMHGAIGYTWEHSLQRFYKRAKLNEVLFGTPYEWNERLAGALPLVAVG